MKKLIYFSLLVQGLFLFSSCGDIFEPDINDETVILIAPGDSIVSNKLNQEFFWEEVKGASGYRVQLASPSLQRPANFYLDTVVLRNNFQITLAPGAYEWRVQGINSAYSTAFTARSFVIDSSASLADQELKLLAPINDSITNVTKLTFKWQGLSMAEKYLFHLNGVTPFDTVLYTTQLTKRLPNISRIYTWKVTALNEKSLQDSKQYRFEVDLNVPQTPVLQFPRVDTVFTILPVKLVWDRQSNDVEYDSLYLYDNQLNILTGFPKRVNAENFILNVTNFTFPAGNYFWAVRSIDKARNSSILSSKRRFIRQ